MPMPPFAIPALILCIVAVPLVLGLIPRNRFYGMRTPQTLSDDGMWYRGNRLAGAAVMIASGVYGVVAVAWPYVRTASDNLATWGLHLVAFVVPLIVGLRLAAWYARRH